MDYINLFKSGRIHIKPENKGKFTESAKEAGKSVQFYIPKAQEGIKTDTIQNTNQFLNTTQKELNKKKVETAEGKKYDLTQLLATGTVPLLAMLYPSWKNPNNKPVVDWMKTPIKQEDCGKVSVTLFTKP